jgi:hypothetical protein
MTVGTKAVSAPTRALARLIVDAKDRESLTYRDMVKRAENTGETISVAYLNNHVLGTVTRAPDAQQLRAIAAATGTTVREVTVAMLEEFYGVTPADISSTGEVERLAAMIPADLPPEDVRAIKALVAAWLASRE